MRTAAEQLEIPEYAESRDSKKLQEILKALA